MGMGNSATETATPFFVLGLGGACNNHCRICLCRRKGAAARGADELFEEARAARPFFSGFLLSDGEPTLVDDLPELLVRLQSLAPRVIQVHTNARRMMYRDYVSRFSRVRGIDYVIRVFSSRPEVHDACTGVAGSLAQTVKGLKNLAGAVGRGSQIHAEIPIAKQTLEDAPRTAFTLWRLGVKSVWLSGGYPALDPHGVSSERAAHALRDIKRQWPALPVQGHFADPPAGLQPGPVHGAAGSPLAGPDTNNPLVFRKCTDSGLETLLVSLPHTYLSSPETFALAPASAASVKGFLDALGYPSRILDLEVGKRGVQPDFDSTLDRVFRETHGRAPEARQALDPLLDQIFQQAKNTQPALVGIASRYEIYNNYDISLYTCFAGLLADYLKAAFRPARVALEYIRKEAGNDAARFAGADSIGTSEAFSEYYFAGLLNMMEYGDRSAAAVYGHQTAPGNSRAVPCDMALLPLPSYGTLDMQAYRMPLSDTLAEFLAQTGRPFEAHARIGCLPVQASLGCIHHCAFCGHQDVFMTRDPVRLADGLADLCRDTGCEAVFFTDRTLNVEETFLSAFCDRILETGRAFLWLATARLQFRDKDLPGKMRAAGCVMLRLGVESGSEPVLKRIRRGFSVAESEETLARIAGAGIVTQINLLSGFAHEHEDDVAATIEYLRRNRRHIDFIASHESYVWQAGMRVDPDSVGLRLAPHAHVNDMGPFLAYQEQGGRTWDEIVAFKEWAFVRIEKEIRAYRLLASLNREADVLHLFRLGHGRDTLAPYLRNCQKNQAAHAPAWDEDSARNVFNRRYRFRETGTAPQTPGASPVEIA